MAHINISSSEDQVINISIDGTEKELALLLCAAMLECDEFLLLVDKLVKQLNEV